MVCHGTSGEADREPAPGDPRHDARGPPRRPAPEARRPNDRQEVSLKLFGTPPTRALRPLWLLNELGLDCEIVPVDVLRGGLDDPSFREVNPAGKVPALLDGDISLCESVAIMMHLAEAHGGGRFLPGDPAGRAAMHQWNFFLVGEIEQPLWRKALHEAIYPEAERRPDEVPLADRDCRRMLVPLEAHLDGREHLVGDGPTVADFNAAYTLDWAGYDGVLDASPNCRRFVERMYDRPAAPVRIAEGFACMEAGRPAPRYRRDLEGGRAA